MREVLVRLFGGSRRKPAGSSLARNTVQQVATAARLLVPGSKVFAVAPTGSMEPTLDGNSFVVAQPCHIADLHEGDIIVRRMPIGNVVHRVIALDPVRTRGDANNSTDSGVVTDNELLGRVFCIVYGSAKQ